MEYAEMTIAELSAAYDAAEQAVSDAEEGVTYTLARERRELEWKRRRLEAALERRLKERLLQTDPVGAGAGSIRLSQHSPARRRIAAAERRE